MELQNSLVTVDGILDPDCKIVQATLRSFRTFLTENHISDIRTILLADEMNIHYAVVVDCTALLKMDITVAEVLFHHYDEAMKLLDETLEDVCREAFRSNSLNLKMILKPYVHVRMKNLPLCLELWRDRIPKAKDIGKFLAVEGTVIRTSSVKLLEYKKSLVCSKCHGCFEIHADFEQCYRIPTPSRCPANFRCNSKKFVVASKNGSSDHKCKDFQEIKVQEQLRKLAMGIVPRAITVILEDDLVDSCKAGDDVIIYGAVKCRWQPLVEGKECDIELVLKANYIEVQNEHRLGISVREEMQNDFECFWAGHSDTPLTARNHILASFCPQIYGLYVVKLAVALVLAGGVPKKDDSGSRVRGEAHILLVGDPGTGKSQFLKYAAKITPRSVLTTGIGSTSAGLTVTAIRDGPHWTLEAGALVLADGGICCIDEFSSIKEHDRGAIHEAMEQQTVSVAKAGLVCKVNTRTSVLAATNPKLGKYDERASIDLNVAIASPLLSRFDIILVLLDSNNTEWDSTIADYVLTGKDVSDFSKDKLWTMDQMQAYFCLIKQINPVLTPDANTILSQYYRYHRKSDFRDAARTTIRLLESLIRIAEAHARLMYRHTVEIIDAVVAVTMMESSMQGASLLPAGNILHSCFPDNPEKQYQYHASLVLKGLHLESLIEHEIISTQMPSTLNITDENVQHDDRHGSPQNEFFTSTVQKIASRGFGTQGCNLDQVFSQVQHPKCSQANNSFGDLSYGAFGRGLINSVTKNSQKGVGQRNCVSTQNTSRKDIGSSSHKKRKSDTTSANDFRKRLLCFEAPSDSFPADTIPCSGAIRSGKQKSTSSHDIDLDDDVDGWFDIDTEANDELAGTSNTIGSSKPQAIPSVFSLDESINTSLLLSEPANSEMQCQVETDAAFQTGKPSIFSLDGSMVEHICNDLLLDKTAAVEPFVCLQKKTFDNNKPSVLDKLNNLTPVTKPKSTQNAFKYNNKKLSDFNNILAPDCGDTRQSAIDPKISITNPSEFSMSGKNCEHGIEYDEKPIDASDVFKIDDDNFWDQFD